MNKRIKELAEQADILFDKGRVPETGFEYKAAEVTVEDLRKFADLLLEEVMQTLFITGHEDAVDTLNKHFGIE